MFEIHYQLKSDLIFLGNLELSQVLLYPCSTNPWVVLVPRVAEVTEIFELSESQQMILLKEINWISKFLKSAFKADKINTAALGNIVSQLHIHIQARYKHDPRWPGTLIGTSTEPTAVEWKLYETELRKAIKSYLTY